MERFDGLFEASRELGVFFTVFREKGFYWGFQEDLQGVDEAVLGVVAVAGHAAAGAGEQDGFEAVLEFGVVGEEIAEVQLALDQVGRDGVGGHVDVFDAGVGWHAFYIEAGGDEEAHAGTGVELLAHGDAFLGVLQDGGVVVCFLEFEFGHRFLLVLLVH